MAHTATETKEARARARARALTGLLWHIGAFVIINGFFWLLDFGIGDSAITWAYWITIFWGLALAFHVLAYLVAGRDVEGRKTEKYLREQ